MATARADRRANLIFLVVCLGATTGCSAPQPEFVPVRGTVKIGDRPLTFGFIAFRPDASRGNGSLHHPIGAIDARGQYELETVGLKGAPAGWYKVLVFADKNQERGTVHPHLPQWATAVKYTREETTDLVIEVRRPAADGAFDLSLSE